MLKKITVFILAAAMMLSLAACTGGKTNQGNLKNPSNKTPTNQNSPDNPENTAPSAPAGTAISAAYKLISFSVEGEEFSGEMIEMMGGGYVVFNGDGTGVFSMFGETFPISYNENTITAGEDRMEYILVEGGMEFTMDDGTTFILEVTEEIPDIPDPTEFTGGDDPDETEPVYGPALNSYDYPYDHPHEGTDLTAYNGIYRAEYPREDDEETWLQVTGYNDYLMLEYYGLMDGSVYRYSAEEFWPGEGWYSSWRNQTVTGKSQEFTSMAQYENYSGLPQDVSVTLTDDGILLNYTNGTVEEFFLDDGFNEFHASEDELWDILLQRGGIHRDFDYQYDSADVIGTWGFWNYLGNACLTFEEDGTFALSWKIPGEPIQVYHGVYGFGEYSGNLEIQAERIGYGSYPYSLSWEWTVDEYGYLNITGVEGPLFEDEYYFSRVEHSFFSTLDENSALGYVVDNLCAYGYYTDRYGIEYSYYYSLPQFYYSENRDLTRINEIIEDFYYPIIETEMHAINEGEILTYDYVDWEVSAYNGVLFLHVFAYTYDWEEHSIFYIDLETMEQMDAREVLARLNLTEEEFLETVRSKAEETFIWYFSDIPEDDRDDYGYYDCLEETVSDEFVNLDLPIISYYFLLNQPYIIV